MCVLDVVVFDCPICTIAISSPEAIHKVLVVDLRGQQALQLIPLNWEQCILCPALVWCQVLALCRKCIDRSWCEIHLHHPVSTEGWILVRSLFWLLEVNVITLSNSWATSISVNEVNCSCVYEVSVSNAVIF